MAKSKTKTKSKPRTHRRKVRRAPLVSMRNEYITPATTPIPPVAVAPRASSHNWLAIFLFVALIAGGITWAVIEYNKRQSVITVEEPKAPPATDGSTPADGSTGTDGGATDTNTPPTPPPTDAAAELDKTKVNGFGVGALATGLGMLIMAGLAASFYFGFINKSEAEDVLEEAKIEEMHAASAIKSELPKMESTAHEAEMDVEHLL